MDCGTPLFWYIGKMATPSLKRTPPDSTPEWPTDLNRVVRQMRLRNRIGRTKIPLVLAQALTELGYPADVVACRVQSVAYSVTRNINGQFPVEYLTETHAMALRWKGRLWTANRCSNWLDELLKLAVSTLGFSDSKRTNNSQCFMELTCLDVTKAFPVTFNGHEQCNPEIKFGKEYVLLDPILRGIKDEIKSIMIIQGLRDGQPLPKEAGAYSLPQPTLSRDEALDWMNKQLKPTGAHGEVSNEEPHPTLENMAVLGGAMALWTHMPGAQLGPLGPMGLLRWPHPVAEAVLKNHRLNLRLAPSPSDAPGARRPPSLRL